MIIGSCPRSPEDIDRLIDEAGVEAIVCLQCELCHGAMEIDWEPIRARALERDVPIVRVAVRDFDRLDQAKMLPVGRALEGSATTGGSDWSRQGSTTIP